MALVSFRPHLLRIVTRTEGSYADNGDWTEGAKTLSDPVPCRYEPNGRASEIRLPDGKVYRYTYTIYLSVNPRLDIKYGDIIALESQDGTDMGEYEVKGFHRGQLDMKIWV